MKKHLKATIGIVVSVITFIVFSTTFPNNPNNIYYSVVEVIDGDTIKIDKEGSTESIRLLGIDAPETNECFYKESKERVTMLLAGEKIQIESDRTQNEKDTYGRLLAYIYLENGVLLNKKLIEEGYAREYTFIIPYAFQTEFKSTQAMAKENKRGLWSETACKKKK